MPLKRENRLLAIKYCTPTLRNASLISAMNMHANPNAVTCASHHAAMKHPIITTLSVVMILPLHRSNPNATKVK